jgi:hypothetical protein
MTAKYCGSASIDPLNSSRAPPSRRRVAAAQRAAAGAVVAERIGLAAVERRRAQSGSMRMPSTFCAIRP